jgi:hypothetical protein
MGASADLREEAESRVMDIINAVCRKPRNLTIDVTDGHPLR